MMYFLGFCSMAATGAAILLLWYILWSAVSRQPSGVGFRFRVTIPEIGSVRSTPSRL